MENCLCSYNIRIEKKPHIPQCRICGKTSKRQTVLVNNYMQSARMYTVEYDMYNVHCTIFFYIFYRMVEKIEFV